MSSNGDGRAHLVHEARKTIKRMRALARLLRFQTGAREFRRVDDALREAGRRLAGARDAEVLATTLSELRERDPDVLAIAPIDALSARLRAAAASGENGPEAEAGVLENIGRMRGELLRWNLLEHETEALAEGLRSIYHSGRRRYRRAERTHGQDPRRMHDWRKRVKALYYALDMLGAKGTAAAEPMRQANRLGDLLGREHDLWMLATHVEQDEQLDDAARATLNELIGRRRERLRKQTLALGAELYRRKPRRFASRMGHALTR